MKKGIFIKVFAMLVLFVITSVPSISAFAGVSNLGTRKIPLYTYVTTSIYCKDTADTCTDVLLGSVTLYGCINATTYAESVGGNFVHSNPDTVCYQNQNTYMGFYSSLGSYMGQEIYLKYSPIDYATSPYYAEITWNYH